MLPILRAIITSCILILSFNSQAGLITYDELIDGDISDLIFAPVASGDTLRVTGSIAQRPNLVWDWDKFTVTFLDDWSVSLTFDVENGTGLFELGSLPGGPFPISLLSVSNYALTSGSAGTFDVFPVPMGNEGTVNYTYEFSVGDQVSVPEPSTLAIFALGMIGLASRRFKKLS